MGLNPCVAESIKQELEALEQVGRVTAEDHRPVHAEFGFDDVETVSEPVVDPVAAIGGINLATDLDDAWSRLKRSINPE
jgi:hypothetical protein